jgi:ParB family chromosome partitioning protein
MPADKYLSYRGDLQAVLGGAGTVAFVTVHPEKQPTALFRLGCDKMTLAADALPAGGTALLTDDDSYWVGGSDGRLYEVPRKGGKPKAKGEPLAGAPKALARVSSYRFAALVEASVAILSAEDGSLVQTLELPEPGSALASDASGMWLAVGTQRGTVLVFECEGKDRFLLSDSQKLHEGAVTALLFEPEELRFFSAGADLKLLSTHARGKLEPEDKGRGNNHTEPVTSMVWAPGDRFITGSRDGTCKTWPLAGNVKPATLKDNLVAVLALTVVDIAKKPHLVAACADNTLRFFPLDEAGKFEDLTHKIHDAYAAAKNELSQNDPKRREEALQTLAGYADARAIDMIAEQMAGDSDHGLRLLAAQLLGKSANPRAVKALEGGLKHNDEAVRVASLDGLRRHLGADDLRPIDLALKTERADIGKLAVQALEKLAQRDDQALTRLTATLDVTTPEVRQAALTSLEKAFDAKSPEADLVGLGSKHADVRRLALVRLFQRQLLQNPKVQSALRWRGGDADAEVRRTAFLVSLYLRLKLVQTLRERDAELQRQLVELENFGKEVKGDDKKGKTAKKPDSAAGLGDAELEPVLQATASRALDTCLRGARGLAVLGDRRALGLLLQLSRRDDTQARVEVCQALAALDDPQSVQRLRSLLFDNEAAVRDAAFTALVQLYEASPLLAAEAGLSAAFEDVRRRGLQVLIDQCRKKLPESAAEPTWQMLQRTLNDSAAPVRSEAFKAALNLNIGGGGIHTFRFILQSIHPDVRLEVLTEAMAQSGEAWAWNLLLEFYNDHDPTLRADAFNFAVKKSKELEPLEAGLMSRYADVRKLAVDGLIKKHTKASQALLAKALNDPEKEVRQRALGSLISDDARKVLAESLASPHDDIRARAADALARHGDRAALAPLLALATAPEPQQKERVADWAQLVETALGGLAALGDPQALTDLLPLLDSKHTNIRQAAARALVWVSRPNGLEPLRQALHHADTEVKYQAALGLAFAGDPAVASVVFGAGGRPQEQLVAAQALGPAAADQMAVFLDHDDESIRQQAALFHLMRDWKGHRGVPTNCLACVSSRMPRVRLAGARALEAFADSAAFSAVVVEQFNDRGQEEPWKVPAEIIETAAVLVTHAPPQLRARVGLLFAHLGDKEAHRWNRHWEAFAERFAGEIAEVRQQHAAPPPPAQQSPAELRHLAFGAYVGLARELGGGPNDPAAAHLVRVRKTAIDRIAALAGQEPTLAAAAQSVLTQGLGDPSQEVRYLAFEHLKNLGLSAAALGGEALESGFTDLGIKGLELLTGGAASAEGQAVLEQVMLSRTDNLAVEAAKLLSAQRGQAAVATLALGAANENLRDTAVQWLAADFDKAPEAPKQLRAALESRYQKVRETVAFALSTKKDAAAFDALVKILRGAADAGKQRRAIQALVTLGDARAVDALLERIDNDPGGTALVDELFRAAGNFRQPGSADRLLALFEKNPKWRNAAFQATLVVSGYDQPISDVEDENPDKTWLTKQHPRHDGVLARLMDRCLVLGETKLLPRLVASARWAPGKDGDPVLGRIINLADEGLRRAAAEAIGWRLRKRGGPAEPLLKLVQHKDPTTQFLAAEGLARARRREGVNVLLASIDYLSDYQLRVRAVQALGELADARALDTLLKLAGEDGHALQEPAAEAIGHLGRSDKAEEIYKLLERCVRGGFSGVAQKALRGLRWLDNPAAWKLIRKTADNDEAEHRLTAIEQLGYNDDPATRSLLLRLLESLDYQNEVQAALTSARRLWGADALDPDFALLRNRGDELESVRKEPLRRVCERGEPDRIFALLPSAEDEVKRTLASSLLNRQPLPVAQAVSGLTSNVPEIVDLAAHLVGRAGPEQAKAQGPAVEKALTTWLAAWHRRRETELHEPLVSVSADELTPLVQTLLWTAGRLHVGLSAMVEASIRPGDDAPYRPLRRGAVAALADQEMTPAVVGALETAARGNDPESRTLACATLARRQPDRTPALAEATLSDRVSFQQLASRQPAQVVPTARKVADQAHYQGVVLPVLVQETQVDVLGEVAANGKLPEGTRLGAIEALARMAREPAEEQLRRVGSADKELKNIRKAAWRALRRSKRLRAKLQSAKK